MEGDHRSRRLDVKVRRLVLAAGDDRVGPSPVRTLRARLWIWEPGCLWRPHPRMAELVAANLTLGATWLPAADAAGPFARIQARRGNDRADHSAPRAGRRVDRPRQDRHWRTSDRRRWLRPRTRVRLVRRMGDKGRPQARIC